MSGRGTLSQLWESRKPLPWESSVSEALALKPVTGPVAAQGSWTRRWADPTALSSTRMQSLLDASRGGIRLRCWSPRFQADLKGARTWNSATWNWRHLLYRTSLPPLGLGFCLNFGRPSRGPATMEESGIASSHPLSLSRRPWSQEWHADHYTARLNS